MRHHVAPQIDENLGRHPIKSLKRLASPLAAARRTVQLELKLNTANPELIDCKRESGKFSGAWHHAAVARGGAAVARMPPRAAA
jgi:hypothetical protein